MGYSQDLRHSDVATTLRYYVDACRQAGVSGRFRGSSRDAGGKKDSLWKFFEK
jgi:hypothetical protein